MVTEGRLIVVLLIIVLLPLLVLDQVILLMVVVVFAVILVLGHGILNLLSIANPTLLVFGRARIVIILVLVIILGVRVLLMPHVVVVLGRSGSRM